MSEQTVWILIAAGTWLLGFPLGFLLGFLHGRVGMVRAGQG